mgnify:CR=1 FL=1
MAVEIPPYQADLVEWLVQTPNYKSLQQKVVDFGSAICSLYEPANESLHNDIIPTANSCSFVTHFLGVGSQTFK